MLWGVDVSGRKLEFLGVQLGPWRHKSLFDPDSTQSTRLAQLHQILLTLPDNMIEIMATPFARVHSASYIAFVASRSTVRLTRMYAPACDFLRRCSGHQFGPRFVSLARLR